MARAENDIRDKLTEHANEIRDGYRRAIRQVVRHLRRLRKGGEHEGQTRAAFRFYRAGVAALDRWLSRFANS